MLTMFSQQVSGQMASANAEASLFGMQWKENVFPTVPRMIILPIMKPIPIICRLACAQRVMNGTIHWWVAPLFVLMTINLH